MVTTANLIRSVEKFYKLALRSYALVKGAAPDDPYSQYDDYDPEGEGGLYDDLLDAARYINSSDLREELLLIAEVYKKALEINNGYQTVINGIYKFKNTNSSELDDEDNPTIEDVLNKCVNDLQSRVGAGYPGDSPEAIAILQKTTRDFVKGYVVEDTSEEELKRAEERDLQDQKQELEELDSPETGEAVVDMTGGVGGDRGSKSYNPGIHTIDGDRTKNWIYHYELELNSYKNQAQSETDPETKKRIETLMNTISSLIKAYQELQLSYTKDQNEGTQNAQLQAKKNISILKQQRAKDRLSIRNRSLEMDLNGLQAKRNAVQDPQQQLIIKQKIESIDKSLNYVGVRKENLLRKKFLKRLEQGYKGSLNPETGKIDFSKDEKEIQAAGTNSISREEYYNNRLRQQKKQIITDDVGKGTKKRNVYDWANMELESLEVHLKQRLATEKSTVKQKVVDKLNAAEKTVLKPYLDDVAKAQNKKDRTALLAAVKILHQKIKEFTKVMPEVIQYVLSVRASKFFYNYKDSVKLLINAGKSSKELTESEKFFVQGLIEEGNKLSKYYANLEIKTKHKTLSTHYGPIAEVIDRINNKLIKDLLS